VAAAVAVLGGLAAACTPVPTRVVITTGGPANNAVYPTSSVAPPLEARWQRALGMPISGVVGAGRRVYVITAPDGTYVSGATVMALDAATGRRHWGPIDLGGGNYSGGESSITYAGGTVLTIAHRVLEARDAATGALRWTTRGRFRVMDDPSVVGDRVIVVTRTDDPIDADVRALRVSDGALLWRHDYDRDSAKQVTATAQGVFATRDCGRTERLDVATGAVQWATGERPCHAVGGPGSPIIAGGRVYLPGNDATVVLDMATGADQATVASEDPPVIARGLVITRTDAGLVALDERNRSRRWTFAGDGHLRGRPAVVDDVVYVGSDRGTLFAADVATGRQRARYQLPGPYLPLADSIAISATNDLLLVPVDQTLVAFERVGTPSVARLTPQPRPAWVPPALGARDAVALQLDAQHSGVIAAGLRPPLRRAWTSPTTGPLTYPLVDRSGVYYTTRGEDGVPQLRGVARNTGAALWPAVPLSMFVGQRFDATLTDSMVVVMDADGVLRGVDKRTGGVRWATSLRGSFPGGRVTYSFRSPPTAHRGIVYVQGSGMGAITFAVDGATGAVRWAAPTDGTDGALSIRGEGQFGSGLCRVWRLERTTGAQVWERRAGCFGGGGDTAVLSGGRLWVQDYFTNDVFDADDGSTLRGFSVSTNLVPAVWGTRAFLAMGTDVVAEDVASGEIAWRYDGTGRVMTSPIVADGVVYAAYEDGTVVGLDATTGRLVWQADVGAITTGSRALAAAHGVLVVPADGGVVAFTTA
jgi:outer membrane protein assembly factor BamB